MLIDTYHISLCDFLLCFFGSNCMRMKTAVNYKTKMKMQIFFYFYHSFVIILPAISLFSFLSYLPN